MLVIPAIDLMDGKVVRLSRGDFATRTVYSDRPAEFAEAFRRAGARRVHVVDLDGARAGHPVNTEVVKAIVATGRRGGAGRGPALRRGGRAGHRHGRARSWCSAPPRWSGSTWSPRPAAASRAGWWPGSTPATAR